MGSLFRLYPLTSPHRSQEKKQNPNSSHINTHFTADISLTVIHSQSFSLGAPTPFMHRTNRHTAIPVGQVPARPGVYFHYLYLYIRFPSLQNLQEKKKYFKLLESHMHEEYQSSYSTACFPFDILYNHLVHCSRFPENSCSTKKP